MEWREFEPSGFNIPTQDTPGSLLAFLRNYVGAFWKDWPKEMMVSNIGDNHQFVVTGECPYCEAKSAFKTLTNPWKDASSIVGSARCISCGGWILAILTSKIVDNKGVYVCENYYPISVSDKKLNESIPLDVAQDFKEAIRCQSVNAYRACVAMCRRAVQTSAIGLAAQGNTLVKQIEDLAAKGIITASLKDFAHDIRLTGNAGAHPDGLQDVKEEDASDIVAFTHQYLDHVYVMPAKLKARMAARAKPSKP